MTQAERKARDYAHRMAAGHHGRLSYEQLVSFGIVREKDGWMVNACRSNFSILIHYGPGTYEVWRQDDFGYVPPQR